MPTQEELEEMMKRLRGEKDSRGIFGVMSRGRPIHNSTSFAAHSGGGSQFGRPKGSGKNQGKVKSKEEELQEAIRRRLGFANG